jgi:hypothetical protein
MSTGLKLAMSLSEEHRQVRIDFSSEPAGSIKAPGHVYDAHTKVGKVFK